MDLFEKLKILTDSAKYDVACTSSGVDRSGVGKGLGSSVSCGICHSFSSDGRCISLLKVLLSNACVYDCKYCINRRSNDFPRATFTPRELADITINFYKRNYIEGLFLSSGIVKSPNYTQELMIEAIRILRHEYNFGGYIHAKAIPGADGKLVKALGLLCDRISVNIELPSQRSLELLAPDKSKEKILKPMGLISQSISENKGELVKYHHAPKFAPAGQSTQMIIGASPESDYQILKLSESLYKKYKLKRVFYSAYIPRNEDTLLPSLDTKPPLLREHRLYQADWLIRYYSFSADEILDEKNPYFNPYLDPKCNWALNHLELFPVEVNRASYEELLRVPGIGVLGAKRIIKARRNQKLDFEILKRLNITLKRAKYFITCDSKMYPGLKFSNDEILRALMSESAQKMYDETLSLKASPQQISFFDTPKNLLEDRVKCLTGQF